MSAQSSSHLTINLQSLFSRTDSDQFDPTTWLNSGPATFVPICSLTRSLKIANIELGNPTQPNTQSSITPVWIRFSPTGSVRTTGIPIDDHLSNSIDWQGHIITSVDSLSRSIQIIDLEPQTVLQAITELPRCHSAARNAVEHAITKLRFEELDEPACTRARRLIAENVRRHELSHVTHSLIPETAIWKDLELHFRWVLLSAEPAIWSDGEFLDRFLARYGTPSSYMTELLAILSEEYSTGDSISQLVRSYVEAHQNDTVETLLTCLRDQEIDVECLTTTLRSKVGAQYCDLWLAYIVDSVRNGIAIADVDVRDFLDQVDAVAATDCGIITSEEEQAELRSLFESITFGPVVEVIRLTDVTGSISLERTWYTLKPNVTSDEQLLAVRRALFRRRFFYEFQSITQINQVLEQRQHAIRRVIDGESLKDVDVYKAGFPPTSSLANYGRTAHTSARTAILGTDSTPEQLNTWLNDPSFGFNTQNSTSRSER